MPFHQQRTLLATAANDSLTTTPAQLSYEIQTLRTIFRVLSDDEFESEILMERQRRDSEKKKPSAVEAAHNNINNTNNTNAKKQAASDNDGSRKRKKNNNDDAAAEASSSRKKRKDNSVSNITLPSRAAIAAEVNDDAARPFLPAQPPAPLVLVPPLTATHHAALAAPAPAPAPFAPTLTVGQVTALLESMPYHKMSQFHQDKWDSFFDKLLAFKAAFGHLNIAAVAKRKDGDKSYMPLFKWVSLSTTCCCCC
jgi:hypothetical protein